MSTESFDSTPADSGDAPLDLAAMAHLMQSQQRQVRSAVDRVAAWIFGVWGIAWALGFLATWSGASLGGNPWFRIDDQVAAIAFTALMSVGMVASIVLGIRAGRGVRGERNTGGMMFGLSFPIVVLAAGMLGGGLMRSGIDAHAAALLWPALFALAIGALYLAGAGIWRSWVQFALGAVLVASAAISTIVGTPHHALVYVGAGLCMLVVGIVLATGVADRRPATGVRR